MITVGIQHQNQSLVLSSLRYWVKPRFRRDHLLVTIIENVQPVWDRRVLKAVILVLLGHSGDLLLVPVGPE